MEKFPSYTLEEKAKLWNLKVDSLSFANRLDEEDPLRSFRSKFSIPKKAALKYADKTLLESKDEECLYFSGHSLGLKPKLVDQVTQQMLQDWGNLGFDCHFEGMLPTAASDQLPKEILSQLVGAKPTNISVMNSLSVNLHLLLTTFYKPTNEKYKIIIEDHAFPTDLLAVESHLRLHGKSPETDLIIIRPRTGEQLIHEEDVLQVIESQGESVALILFPGIQYYTGQLFNIQQLTQAAHKKDIIVGIDLAHAVGNVKLQIHEWEVDFAVWCTYKYLNSGAGGIGGLFVHEKWLNSTSSDPSFPMFKGWWGSHGVSSFLSAADVNDSRGADIFRLSTPHALLNGMLWASLKVFSEATMDKLIAKQFLLTGYLEYLINHCSLSSETSSKTPIVKIVTPSNPKQRGTQLSLMFSQSLEIVQEKLQKHGIVCDVRMPNVIRVAPIPMYNTFKDVYTFVHILNDICKEIFH